MIQYEVWVEARFWRFVEFADTPRVGENISFEDTNSYQELVILGIVRSITEKERTSSIMAQTNKSRVYARKVK
jgi:hypothetical protein